LNCIIDMKNTLEQLGSQVTDLTKKIIELEEQLAVCLRFMRIKAEKMVELREQHRPDSQN
jgi:thermostable 8-oxoguanine DNA glycosylase